LKTRRLPPTVLPAVVFINADITGSLPIVVIRSLDRNSGRVPVPRYVFRLAHTVTFTLHPGPGDPAGPQ
jgi:hypothetical protein